ncbi:MAG: cytochrome o ubiquinol oxidase subunit IV [Gammaproteobacteria bacterium]
MSSMSNQSNAVRAGHASGQTKTKLYATGFILSVLLTLVAFYLVDKQLLSTNALYIAVGVLAFVQAIVQVFCFVRSNTSKEDGQWNVLAFIFTIGVIVILVGGSLWIMYNLNYNMGH